MSQDEDTRDYKVLVNEEGQYSLWLASQDAPKGWKETDKKGNKADCLAYVSEVWTDMRPLSLRRKMEEGAGAQGSN
jgi:MbtH protein